ncbi:hypothetical protein DFA_04088 [Cavenderia fasciculata]|uniref:Uncharacterized protein n=1 Tax=Cavenderia fasciculata TaxID=261658 RepID=F4Q193_CACFS|nr:uncharacterized protein DFA_04088 [Cavenderia fasciculata]EGG18594.1 hypothetical protein DFA_04088 [Cavenderia fasciculata]|eukprot:XP_004366498.1 hypothetical protein DFA_04088 [Cavenderia fasciculata]
MDSSYERLSKHFLDRIRDLQYLTALRNQNMINPSSINKQEIEEINRALLDIESTFYNLKQSVHHEKQLVEQLDTYKQLIDQQHTQLVSLGQQQQRQ